MNNFHIIFLFICLIALKHPVTTHANQQPFGHDILLIINYNHAYYNSIPILRDLYSPWFPNIVFYGPKSHPDVHICQHHEGWFAYTGIADAMQRYPQFNGYLQVHDDCIINCWNFTRFDKNKIWQLGANPVDLSTDSLPNWLWWKKEVGYQAAQQFYAMLSEKCKETLKKNCGLNSVAWGYSDIVYFPGMYKNDVILLCSLSHTANLFLEIALPTFCRCLADQQTFEYVSGIALWDNKNLITSKYTKKLDYAHPLKLSDKNNIDFIKAQYKLKK